MNNEYTLGELAKKVTGLENGTLALYTFEFCNSIYPLEAFKPIMRNLLSVNWKKSYDIRYLNNINVRKGVISGDDFRKALHNDKDPDLTEIQEFCAPMKNLEFKFSKFESLVLSWVLDCQVSGDKNGAYIVNLSFRANKPEEKDALFMKKFNPEDFKEEDK